MRHIIGLAGWADKTARLPAALCPHAWWGAALGQGNGVAEDGKRAVLARRAFAPERRERRFVMLMSDEDHARIKAVAQTRGVSMARLMQEAALSASYDRRERLAVIAALDCANRLLANIAGNINQLAYHANIAEQVVAHAELEHALGQVRDVREELAEVLRQVK